MERQTLEREEERAKQRHGELEMRLAQLQKDIERETDAIGEAKALLKKLGEEEAELRASSEDDAAAREIVQEGVADAAEALSAADAALQTAIIEDADGRARRAQAEARIQEYATRTARLAAQLADVERQITALGGSGPLGEMLSEMDTLRDRVARFAEELEVVEAQTADAEAALPEARAREKDAREAAQQARLKARQLETEVATLVKLLMPGESAKWRPAVDAIRVSRGYEVALGAALERRP